MRMTWANWIALAVGLGTNVATIPAVCADVAAHPTISETWPWTDRRQLWAFVYERWSPMPWPRAGKTPEQVEASYMASHPGATPNQAFFFMLNDLTFRIPAIRMAQNRLAAPGHKNNTWMSVFAWKSQEYYAFNGYPANDPKAFPAGAYHASDMGFAFGIPEQWSYGPWQEFAPYVAGHIGQAGYGTWYPLMTWPSQLVPQLHETPGSSSQDGDPNNRYIPTWKPLHNEPAATLGLRTLTEHQPRLVWRRQAALGVRPSDPLYDCPTNVAIP